MKKHILTLVGIFTIGVSYAQKIPVPFNELPLVAQKFVEQHFGTEKVASVVKESEFLKHTEYNVYLTDGTEIEFANDQWKEVNTRTYAVPSSIVNNNILNYVTNSFPNTFIKEIKKKKRGGFKVELSNGVDLEFNNQGSFIRFDD